METRCWGGDRVDIANGPRKFERRVEGVAGYEINSSGVVALVLRLQGDQIDVARVTKIVPDALPAWE